MKSKIFISSVQVMLFPDRLEVSSPGPLPKGMTVAKLKRRHRSVPVNPLLAQGMYLRGYIEHVGSGTGDIIDKCRENGLPPPQWESEDDGLTIVLQRKTITAQQQMAPQTARETDTETTRMKKGVEKGGMKGGMESGMESGMKTSDAIIALMRADSQITHDILAARLCKARNSIIKQIAKLKKMGLIRRIGPDKGGHWEVIG